MELYPIWNSIPGLTIDSKEEDVEMGRENLTPQEEEAWMHEVKRYPAFPVHTLYGGLMPQERKQGSVFISWKNEVRKPFPVDSPAAKDYMLRIYKGTCMALHSVIEEMEGFTAMYIHEDENPGSPTKRATRVR